MDSFPLHKYWNVNASCSQLRHLWVWCTLIYLSPVFRMTSKSFYLHMRLDSPIHCLSFPFPVLSNHLWIAPSTAPRPTPLLFQYLWNHKNPSAMSHFSRVNLIQRRQPMCCTSGNDGCCSTCGENVLVEQNLPTNYFASISNGNRLFLWACWRRARTLESARGINNGCNLSLKKHL